MSDPGCIDKHRTYIVVLYSQKDTSHLCNNVREMCYEDPQCVGIVLIMGLTRGVTGWVAHSAWYLCDVDAAWLINHSQTDTEIIVSLESGDVNEALLVFQSWPWIFLTTFGLDWIGYGIL